MIVALLIFILKIINLLENLLISVNIIEKDGIVDGSVFDRIIKNFAQILKIQEHQIVKN